MQISSLFINWSADPVAFQIGSLSVRYYGLLFVAALVADMYVFKKIFKWEKLPLALLDKLSFWAFVSLIVGLRLGHCLFYDPAYYLSHPVEILKIWEGGLASHGAAVGLLVGLCFFCRKYGVSYLWLFDRIVIVVALTGFFIRLGNLINSEIYGIPTSLSWGFVFVRNGDPLPRHPTQIYESLAYLCMFVVLFFIYKKKPPLRRRSGCLFGLALTMIFGFRFLVEFLKETQHGGVDSALHSALGLDMGQMLSIPLIVAGVWLLCRSLRRPPDSKPFTAVKGK